MNFGCSFAIAFNVNEIALKCPWRLNKRESQVTYDIEAEATMESNGKSVMGTEGVV